MINTATNPNATTSAVGASQADFDCQFEDLLRTWNKHQELRVGNAPLPTLWKSNATLAGCRLAVATAASR